MRLKPFEIQIDERHRLVAAAAASANHLGRGIETSLAVRQAGQRIEVGQPLDVLGMRAPRASVPARRPPRARVPAPNRRASAGSDAQSGGVLVNRDPKRAVSPARIGARGTYFQHMVTRAEIRERDVVLGAEINPAVAEVAADDTTGDCAPAR